MASDARSPSDPVDAPPGLAGDVAALDFFQALRRLECAHRDRPRLGEAAHASEEPVRLAQDPSLAFQSWTLASYQAADERHMARLAVGFFGAFGPNGPLPLHLTEYAQQRSRNAHDPTFASFVNLFHHRLLLLFYRAWASARPALSHDRVDDDRFAAYTGALGGLGYTRRRSARDSLDQFALYMAGHFASGARHAEGLEKLVSAYFRIPVRVEEFTGEWLAIPDDYTWKLGLARFGELGSRADGGAATGAGRLGLGTRLGRRTYERQFKFRLVLGPLRRQDYDRFMPDGDFVRPLMRLVERYAGLELSWDVRLVLEKPDQRPTRLDGSSQLGRSSHLVRRAQADDRPFQDLIFTPLDKAPPWQRSAAKRPSAS
jgi:type VI secretion system protein ImpH